MAETSRQSSPTQGPPSLGASARASILWGGGFMLLRDVAQFGVMLILVRLLTPADYGTAALVQAILGVVAVVSFGTFSTHALQMRNPDEIDWQAHFTAAVVLNVCLSALVLALAFALSLVDRYRDAALPLAVLSVVFMIEIPGTLRHRMLEANHDWKRFRLLLIAGTLLGLGSGLIVALMGGGVWALIVQIPMLGIPAAIDLFYGARFKPDLTWSWARWREPFHFGALRALSGLMTNGRHLMVAAVIAATFDLMTLGIFSRAVGLATLCTGRIGVVASTTLYPIITRAEAGSASMRRITAIFLRGVFCSTIMMATIVAVTAPNLVDVLYGGTWDAVKPLLPIAAASVAANGGLAATTSLLLANNDMRACFWLDAATNGLSILAAFLLLPFGPFAYLTGLAVINLVLLATGQALLVKKRATETSELLSAVAPGIIAAMISVLAVAILRSWFTSNFVFFSLIVESAVVALVFVYSLRFLFPRELEELVLHVTANRHVRRILFLAPVPA